MAELWFVGLGLDDERGLSRRALDVLASSEVLAEEYTATAPPGTLDRLAAAIGRPIRTLDRERLESETPVLEALGRSPRVCLLVVGDPFAATTHVALRLAAERAGHTWHYLPNASILTAAAGFLGLMHYRFGRTVSLPLPGPRLRPPFAARAHRGEPGAGTPHAAPSRPPSARGPFPHGGGGARDPARTGPGLPRYLAEETMVAVAARVGRSDAAGFYGPFGRMRGRDFGPPLHAVVVPAPELHFEESAALERFRCD